MANTKYKVGDLFFWYSRDDLFGKAIDYYNKKTFGRSDTTHIGIISEIRGDKVLIHEAGPKGFISSEYDLVWLESTKACKIGRVKEKMNDVFATCEKYKGIGYGWLDIIAIMFSFLTGWKVLGITGKNSIICSEAVSRIVYDCTKSVNFAKEWNVVYDAVSPQMIYQSKFVEIIKG